MTDIELAAGPARVELSAKAGGRVSSLQLQGVELLVTTPSDDPLMWGTYPMVPWAGRLRYGRFEFGGRSYGVPRDMEPHAIHGTGYTRPWSVVGDNELEFALDQPWPFGGRVVHRAELEEDRLTLTLEVHADDVAMPAMAGWHPWFRRDLGRGAPLELGFEASAMYEIDDQEIPTGALSAPPPGPWDNCFTGVTPPVTVRWPGFATLELGSSCDHWVVYDHPQHAVCVEPQTGAPDEFNRTPVVVEPGDPLVATFELSWDLW